MLKVVVLGYGQMLTNVIAGCLDAGCDVVGVFRYDKVRYRKIDGFLVDTFNPSVEYNYIKSYGLHEINAKSANSADFKKELIKLEADVVIVATWGEKIKKHIIDTPKIAMINVHPALLPKYRGPNPYLEVIRHLEPKTGVTFHLMDENFDTGSILLQKEFDIKEDDTGKELRERAAICAREGVKELIKNLDEDIIIPLSQDNSRASYYPQITEEDIMLDFSKPAKEVVAQVRAFHPWYKCYFRYNHHFFYPNPYKVTVLENTLEKAEVGMIVSKSYKNKSITIVCGDKKLVKMDGVKLYGLINRFLTSFYIKNVVKKMKKVY